MNSRTIQALIISLAFIVSLFLVLSAIFYSATISLNPFGTTIAQRVLQSLLCLSPFLVIFGTGFVMYKGMKPKRRKQ